MKKVSSKKVLIDYEHRLGRNCASSCWSGILRHQGYNIDQTDLFGMGNGLMFLYHAVPKAKIFNMLIVSSDIVSDFFTNTGIGGIVRTYRNDDYAFKQILRCLDMGIPISAELNPQFSENLISKTDKSHLSHIFRHWIVIVGYDLERNVLILYDSAILKSFEININDFKKGRSTGNYTQNPRNFFFSITPPDELYPEHISMLLSLRKTTFKFLHVEKYNNASLYCGKYGYEKAIRQIGIWNRMMDPETLLFRITMLKTTLLVGGLAKGAYRYTFSEYLTKCANILQLKDLIEVAKFFKESGDLWRDFIQTLDVVIADIGNPIFWGNDSLLAKKLEKIYTKELSGFELLNQTINK